MDTKRQGRRNYVTLYCVCILLVAVRNGVESALDESLEGFPAGQGTEDIKTVDAHHDGEEKQTNKEEGHTLEGKQTETTIENAGSPPDDPTEEVDPVTSGSQEVGKTDPKPSSPLPPDGESHIPEQQREAPVRGTPPVEDSQSQPAGGAENVALPDTPTGQLNKGDPQASFDAVPGPKSRTEPTEPETPKAEHGTTSTNTRNSPDSPAVQTASVPADGPQDATPKSSQHGTDASTVKDPQEAIVKTDEVKAEVIEGENVDTEGAEVWEVGQEGEGQDEKVEGEKQEKVGEEKSEEPAGEEPEAPKREQDLPSFDEWKEKIIAEQAQQAKQAKQEKMEAQAPQQVNKKKVNYASVTCGAKLVVANPEAKNAASVLNENKDQYMIQPCQAKKWFVVELCEPVAIQSLEIANLELFSSLPESFIVYTSERYPTKEWTNLGTFRARDERAVQSFPIMEEDMFSKYIKVEPLTHYGVEHYCPLTLVRVYGTTVVEDYEDADHMEHAAVDDDTTVSDDKPSNLFTSATENSSGTATSWIDTVISLVKTVLSPGEKEKENKIDDIVKMNATTRNRSIPNVSHNLAPEGDQASPCTPGVSSGEPTPDRAEGPSPTHLPITPRVSDQPPIVTLIESHPHTTKLPDLIQQCNFCRDLNQPTCYSDRSHVCGYYRATNFVLGTSCISKIGPKSKEEMENLEKRPWQIQPLVPKKTKTLSQDHPAEADASQRAEGDAKADESDTKQVKKAAGKPDERTVGEVPPQKVVPNDHKPSTGCPTLEASMQDSEATQPLQKEGSETHTAQVQATQSVTVPRTEGIKSTLSETKTGTEVPLTTSFTSCDSSQTDCSTMGPDIVQIRPTTTEEAMKTATAQNDQVQGAEDTQLAADTRKVGEKQPEPSKVVPNGETGGENNGTNGGGGEKVIYADTPGSHDHEYELEMLPSSLDEGEAVHKLSSGRRENAFMRLKNRIKALELNLTLSSRYLEELSKRYRREMEDMYLSLNKTILKLTNTSRTAEQRDVRQQANITDLTKRINHLTEQVETLKESLGNIHTQVIERHLFLMMVEFVIFLLIITWLLNRVQQPRNNNRVSTHPTVTTTTTTSATASTNGTKLVPPLPQPNKPPDKQKKGVHKVHRRRNSIDATPPRPKVKAVVSGQRSKDDLHIRLSGSESSFGADVLEAVAAASSSSEFKEIPKKRKRKKNKGLVSSQSTSNITSQSSSYNHSKPSTTTSVSRVHNKVGIIFSSKNTNPRDTSPTNSSCSSEGGEHHVSSSVSTGGVTTGKGKKQVTARRSLDLKDLHKQHSDPGPLPVPKHRRAGSDGANKNGTSPVTDIGPLYRNSKSSNGSTPLSESPPSTACSSSGWKNWLLGTRN